MDLKLLKHLSSENLNEAFDFDAAPARRKIPTWSISGAPRYIFLQGPHYLDDSVGQLLRMIGYKLIESWASKHDLANDTRIDAKASDFDNGAVFVYASGTSSYVKEAIQLLNKYGADVITRIY